MFVFTEITLVGRTKKLNRTKKTLHMKYYGNIDSCQVPEKVKTYEHTSFKNI